MGSLYVAKYQYVWSSISAAIRSTTDPDGNGCGTCTYSQRPFSPCQRTEYLRPQSPTPSEADQERRQEDRNLGSPHPGGPIGEGDETLDEGGQVDLDASVEDLDASVDDLDASMAEDEAGGDEGDGDEGDDDNMDE